MSSGENLEYILVENTSYLILGNILQYTVIGTMSFKQFSSLNFQVSGLLKKCFEYYHIN